MDGTTEPHDQPIRTGVKLNLVRDGVYTFAIFSLADDDLDALRAAKDRAVTIARELEAELPCARPKNVPLRPRRRVG